MAIFKTKEQRKAIKLLKREKKHLRQLLKSADEEMEDVIINYQREKKINENYSALIANSTSGDLITRITGHLKSSDDKLLKIRRKIVKQDQKVTSLKDNIDSINKSITEIKLSK